MVYSSKLKMSNRFTYLGRVGFDNAKYINEQAKAIIKRACKFHKLYLEFGGKLLYDYHAAHVLPGYELDSKMHVIKRLIRKNKGKVEFVFCVSAKDLQSGKRMGALGISYHDFSLKMLDSIERYGFKVPNIVISLYSGETKAQEFGEFLKKQGYNIYYRRFIPGYPENIKMIASPYGFGEKPFIKTTKPIVIVAGAGPGSGKMSTCLTMVYQDYLCGKDSGYAKFETFPIWNIPINNPINVAYEAATADIGDYNLIDPYHMKKYHVKAVNYNRDVENYMIIQRLLKQIISKENYMNNYYSPTDMGINTAKDSITDLKLCVKAARQEIIRRYFRYYNEMLEGKGTQETVDRISDLMEKNGIKFSERKVIIPARKESEIAKKKYGKKLKTGVFSGAAIMLSNDGGVIVSGHNSPLMHSESAVIMYALKKIAGINKSKDIISSSVLAQIKELRKGVYQSESENLNISEILIALAVSARYDKNAKKAFDILRQGRLRSCEMHTTHALTRDDESVLRKLGINTTSDGKRELGKLYIG
ncbi:DUF1846 family protein [Candidatus Micrarchaeota archaeon]|nr:DUF1846 family protein [Candidatus Micrarchaeota archaeon]